MNSTANAILGGLISGISAGYDRDVADLANQVPTSEAEASGKGEGTDYVTGPNSGTKYAQVKTNRADEIMSMMAHTASSFFDTGDEATALKAGSQALQNIHNTAFRARQAADLDAQGFDPQGIQAYIKSGDKADLVTGMGEVIIPDPTNPSHNIRVSAKEAMAMKQAQAVAKPDVHFGPNGAAYTVEYDANGKPNVVTLKEGEAKKENLIRVPNKDGSTDWYDQQGNFDHKTYEHGESHAPDTSNAPVYTSPVDKAKAATEFRQDSKILADDTNKRVSAASQISAASVLHKDGNTWADQSVTANFQKIEAPSLSPRMSQFEGMLHHSGTTWNSVDRTYNKVVNGQPLSDDDVKNIKIISDMSADSAYMDWWDNYGEQRKALVDGGVNEERLIKPAKPAGFDSRHPDWVKEQGGSGKSAQAEPTAGALGTTTKPDGTYKLKSGKTVRVSGGHVYEQ